MDGFTLFFAGLCGETQPILSPSTGEPVMERAVDPISGESRVDADGSPVMIPVLARRTMALRYATPGTPATPAKQPVKLIEETHVMR